MESSCEVEELHSLAAMCMTKGLFVSCVAENVREIKVTSYCFLLVGASQPDAGSSLTFSRVGEDPKANYIGRRRRPGNRWEFTFSRVLS